MTAAPAPTMLPSLERLAAWLRRHPRRVERAALVVVFALALAYRLDGLPRPLVDHHSWRQCDTAAIARNYVEEDACILRPRIDWRGLASGEVEWNFPLFSYAVSLLYRVFGIHDVIGRLLSIVYSMAALGALFLLVRRKHGAGVALWAAAYFAINPLAAYFGRAFMPESLLVLAGLTFLLAIDRWAERGSPGSLALATGALTIAGLVKLPFGFRDIRVKSTPPPGRPTSSCSACARAKSRSRTSDPSRRR